MLVMQLKRSDALLEFVVERHAIYRRRQRGEPKPWTTWPELQQFKFCNVYRELDRVTEWIADNWREPHAADPDLWFAMCVARFVNWPDTLEEIGYPVPWEQARFVEVMEDRMARKEKVFTGAYMIHADLKFQGSKAAYLAQEVFAPLWHDRAALRPRKGDTLASFAKRLMQHRDMGGFMVGQIIADTKQVQPLRGASDWWTWAISGPGSRRGLIVCSAGTRMPSGLSPPGGPPCISCTRS